MTRRHLAQLASGAAAAAGLALVVAGGPASASTSPPPGQLAPIHGPYAPKIDPANFVAAIDNKYLPYKPGTRIHFVGVRGKTRQTDDQWRLAELTGGALPAPPAPATLREALGRNVSPNEAAEALIAALEEHEGTVPRDLPLDAGLRARMDALIVRYLDDGWTWRR